MVGFLRYSAGSVLKNTRLREKILSPKPFTLKDSFLTNCNVVDIHDFRCGVLWCTRIRKSLDDC
jgi:hypothetical protein